VPIELITQLLRNSGFRVLGTDGDFLLLEDPSCFLRSLSDFMDVAWIAVSFIAGVMLFGWAVAMIRGAKNDIMINIRNLTLIFGTLAAAKPIVNMIWGGDLFAAGCSTVMVPVSEIRRVLAARDLKLEVDHEILDVWDSARWDEYYDAMRNADPGDGMNLTGAGTPPELRGVRVTPATAVSGNGAASARIAVSHANGHAVVNPLSVLNGSDIETARAAFNRSGMRIRIQDNSGGGGVGARRRDARTASGYRDHEGRDLLANPGTGVPSFFNGVVASVRPMHHGLWGMTIRNDNGTTAYIGYVSTALNAGDRVRAGDLIGAAQRIALAPEYRNVPNHVHYELWRGQKGGGQIMDIADAL
jgi:hypothetical protein